MAKNKIKWSYHFEIILETKDEVVVKKIEDQIKVFNVDYRIIEVKDILVNFL